MPFDLRTLTVAFAAVVALAPGLGAQTSPATTPPAGNTDKGRQVYLKDGCHQCHGRVGQGAVTGPRVGPPAQGFDAFARYVRHPRGEMPPYGAKILSDTELADMYAFLRALPKPPAVATLPFDK